MKKKDFVLLDLDGQYEQVLDLIDGWPVEEVIRWMERFGTVRRIPHPMDDQLYHFRAANEQGVGFRFDEAGQLVLILSHTTRTRSSIKK